MGTVNFLCIQTHLFSLLCENLLLKQNVSSKYAMSAKTYFILLKSIYIHAYVGKSKYCKRSIPFTSRAFINLNLPSYICALHRLSPSFVIIRFILFFYVDIFSMFLSHLVKRIGQTCNVRKIQNFEN